MIAAYKRADHGQDVSVVSLYMLSDSIINRGSGCGGLAQGSVLAQLRRRPCLIAYSIRLLGNRPDEDRKRPNCTSNLGQFCGVDAGPTLVGSPITDYSGLALIATYISSG